MGPLPGSCREGLELAEELWLAAKRRGELLHRLADIGFWRTGAIAAACTCASRDFGEKSLSLGNDGFDLGSDLNSVGSCLVEELLGFGKLLAELGLFAFNCTKSAFCPPQPRLESLELDMARQGEGTLRTEFRELGLVLAEESALVWEKLPFLAVEETDELLDGLDFLLDLQLLRPLFAVGLEAALSCRTFGRSAPTALAAVSIA